MFLEFVFRKFLKMNIKNVLSISGEICKMQKCFFLKWQAFIKRIFDPLVAKFYIMIYKTNAFHNIISSCKNIFLRVICSFYDEIIFLLHNISSMKHIIINIECVNWQIAKLLFNKDCITFNSYHTQ